MKIRVLASPFQLELIRRMGGNPIAMTLADVLPGLQQGTIDGTLTTMTIYTTMQYYDVGKFVHRNRTALRQFDRDGEQEMDGHAAARSAEDRARQRQQGLRGDHPCVKEFFAEQDKIWSPRAASHRSCRTTSTRP